MEAGLRQRGDAQAAALAGALREVLSNPNFYVSANTLRWWSSRLGHDTRAEHGLSAAKPIEIAVPAGAVRTRGSVLEVEVGDAVVRCDVGTDVAYVAAVVRTLRGS
jgi:hypothetical protein